MIHGVLSMFSWRYPAVVVYMLQSTEYRVGPYLAWFWKTSDFTKVMQRRTLEHTRAVRLLLLALRVGMVLQIAVGLMFIGLGQWHAMAGGLYFGLALFISYPLVWGHMVTVPLILGRIFIVNPRQRQAIHQAEAIFAQHSAVKIAIAGSYGKTSMKELLLTVLSEGKKVAATPANKNVAISQAYFAQKLQGDEDVLLIEYGEAGPGDVARFAKLTHPTHAVITGVAPAHLEAYKSLDAAARDIFSVAKDGFVKPQKIFVNTESPAATQYLHKDYQQYNQNGALGWKVSDVHIGLDGTRFTLKKARRTLRLTSKLVGRHQVGPLALVASLAAELGLSDSHIEAGIAKTAPFEHRMQPYQLDGAWIIDDTYNGNIEGIRAGTTLLKTLPAKRKIYVTPGLVDQGPETRAVHEEMGALIAAAAPDVVVLMQNSVTLHIQNGLRTAGFRGEIILEKDPLHFYTNLSLFVARGDLVLMQNDWTDNYR